MSGFNGEAGGAPRLVAAATESGSARALIPVLRGACATGRLDVVTCFEGVAAGVLASDWPEGAVRQLPFPEAIAAPFGVVLAGTTLGESVEKALTRAARERGVPSAVILDSWYGYRRRFETFDRNWQENLPDIVLVNDDIAAAEASRDGIPAERLRVAGQPALDDTVRFAGARRSTAHTPARKVVFVSEPLRLFHERGVGDGIDEVEAFGLLTAAIRMLPRDQWPEVVVRPHPAEAADEWPARIAMAGLRARVDRDGALLSLLAGADLVFGISSIVLVHALLLGIPFAVLQHPQLDQDALVLTRGAIVPRLHTPDEVLRALMRGPPAPDRDAARPLLKTCDGEATSRVLALLLDLAAVRPR